MKVNIFVNLKAFDYFKSSTWHSGSRAIEQNPIGIFARHHRNVTDCSLFSTGHIRYPSHSCIEERKKSRSKPSVCRRQAEHHFSPVRSFASAL